MKTGARLGIFGAGVVVVFTAAAGVGAAVGPIDVGTSSNHSTMSTGSPAVDPAAGPAVKDAVDDVGLSGLTIAAGGYRLEPEVVTAEAETPSMFMFRIVSVDGSAVTDFDLLHDRRMHLIVVSRNLVDFLHLHPTLDASGVWMADLPELSPGSYRVYADFRPTGAEQITLSTDLSVAGVVVPHDVPSAQQTTEVDGFSVAVSGVAAVGDSSLTFAVTRDGSAVAAEPYLGAAGHLVVIRDGDLGYLHVHPVAADDGSIQFVVEFPTPGRYRMFFEFSIDGTVRTAAFTADVSQGGLMIDDHESNSS